MIAAGLVAAHRRDLAEINRLALLDLGVAFNTDDGPIVMNRLRRLLPELVSVYGSAAAALAADWYEEARDAERVPGRARAVVAALPDNGRFESLAGWAVGPLFSRTPDISAAKALASGGVQRIVFDADRETILRSVREDEHGVGYRRVTSGGCGFCKMLAGRGSVYRTMETARFRSHDNCFCFAAPVYDIDLTGDIDLRDSEPAA